MIILHLVKYTFIKMFLLALSLVLSSILIQGCGWQLRGTDNLATSTLDVSAGLSNKEKKRISVNPIYATGQRDFRQIFNRLLTSNEIQTSYEARISLAFEKENISRRAQAYGSTGIPAQYLLTMSMSFRLTDNKNPTNNIERKVVARRDYDFDAELVGAKDREQQALLNEMREELAQQVFRVIIQSQRK